MNALIGSTGFIGGNLAAQEHFDDAFHSANIEEIAGRSYELIACAGAPGRKWLANREPEADRQAVQRLMHALDCVQVRHFVLISTVDVYPHPIGVDEDTPIDRDHADAYGRHRHQLEQFVAQRFDATILRLPGLFGPGLKKNVIYDFLNDNRLDLINPASTFQFYDLSDLWRDVQQVRSAGLGLINFATEPVSVSVIARDVFGFEFRNEAPVPEAHYDFRTKHANLLGGANGYLHDRAQVLRSMRRFVVQEKQRATDHLEHRLAPGG